MLKNSYSKDSKPKSIAVSVAIIQNNPTAAKDEAKKFLVAWRNQKQHQGGCFEFVGGKQHADETSYAALVRECQEELGILVKAALPLTRISHDYSDKQVTLHVYLVTAFSGQATGAEGQLVRWVTAAELLALPMPAANAAIKRLALLKPVYLISQSVAAMQGEQNWLDFYASKLPKHAQFYVRDKELAASAYTQLLAELHQRRTDLQLIALYKHQSAVDTKAVAGFHLAHDEVLAADTLDRSEPYTYYVCACHDEQSITKANALGAEAMTLSPVQQSPSHPSTKPMGWQQFATLAKQAHMPVYALGGMCVADIQLAQQYAGFGVAGISLINDMP